MLGPIISLTDLVNLSAKNSKQKRLNLKEKVELIEDHGWNGYEIDELAKKYQIANAAIFRILREKQSILKTFQKASKTKAKKVNFKIDTRYKIRHVYKRPNLL